MGLLISQKDVFFLYFVLHIINRFSPPHRTKQQDLFNSMGSMYSAVLLLGIQNSQGVQPVIAMERIVFYKQRAAGMYSALPYTFAQVTNSFMQRGH